MPTVTVVEESSVYRGLLSDLPVTPQAVTSRVILNNPLVRMVVFAFDTGEMLTDHMSPRAAIVHLLDGEITFTVGAEEHHLTAGDVVYLAPGQRHALVALAPSRMSLIMIDTTYAAGS